MNIVARIEKNAFACERVSSGRQISDFIHRIINFKLEVYFFCVILKKSVIHTRICISSIYMYMYA